MKQFLFRTNESKGLFLLRTTLGLVIFPHGAQKLTGWFGGYGFSGTMDYLTSSAGLPWMIAFLVIPIEFFGSLLLLAGAFTRVVAFCFIVLFLGILFTVHLEYGFFMNWFGNQKGEGIEYFLLVLGISLCLLISGAGGFSFDRILTLSGQESK